MKSPNASNTLYVSSVRRFLRLTCTGCLSPCDGWDRLRQSPTCVPVTLHLWHLSDADESEQDLSGPRRAPILPIYTETCLTASQDLLVVITSFFHHLDLPALTNIGRISAFVFQLLHNLYNSSGKSAAAHWKISKFVFLDFMFWYSK